MANRIVHPGNRPDATQGVAGNDAQSASALNPGRKSTNQQGMGQTAEERRAGRQEPDADGATSEADSAETSEAIRKSPQADGRRGPVAVGKSGQGAMKDARDAVEVRKFDNFKDISPRKKR